MLSFSPRLSSGQTIVVASHNEGKVREIRALLAPFGLKTVSAAELDLPEPDETETTYAGNARLKAVAATAASGYPALSDDSGIDVTALDGQPGIYAARWAEDDNGDDRSARFVCALCLAFPDGSSDVYEGECKGDIVWPPRGDRGFGYDPIFVMDGDTQTFAEIDPQAKHDKSHRADAFAKFLADQFPDGPAHDCGE
jgi:XTP/dITP diphosphohydrolase